MIRYLIALLLAFKIMTGIFDYGSEILFDRYGNYQTSQSSIVTKNSEVAANTLNHINTVKK